MLRWLSSLRQTLTRPARINRRREQRRPYKTAIEIRAGTGVTYRGISRDLSPGGMGAVVTAYLEIGHEIWISYEHPSDGAKTARAIVRRATVRQRFGYRYGFEFSVPIEVGRENNSAASE